MPQHACFVRRGMIGIVVVMCVLVVTTTMAAVVRGLTRQAHAYLMCNNQHNL
jgi:hypothetical protein